MDRRELLNLLGASAGLAAFGAGAWAGEPARKAKSGTHAGHAHGEHEHGKHPGGKHEEHLRTLAECVRICNETAHHCLGQLRKGAEDREVHAKIHEATMDCQAFCVLAATLMSRKSRMAKYAHAACADACRDCAAVCEKGPGEITSQCAEICRKCEEACRRMAEGTA